MQVFVFFFFFPQFCDVAEVGIIHKMIWPGYRLDMKVEEKNRILLPSWLPTGTYPKYLMIWKLFFKCSEFESFFPWKILCLSPNHTFQVEIRQKFASQRKNFLDVRNIFFVV
jgi:hypothetical protein